MNLRRFFSKCRSAFKILTAKAKVSYSQAGEDVIVNYLFTTLDIKNPTYLEIGTNQPVMCNNTFFFYNRGDRGVCVEPDSEMYDLIKKTRPGDTILNVGIGLSESKEATFYLFPGLTNGWSTFSREEAILRKQESGIEPQEVKVPLVNINTVIEKYFSPHPNFISLDVEGMDLEILKSLDFNRFRPDVICVETITFSITNTEEKINEIADFMSSKEYMVYADTHINTIFCKKELFNK